MMFYTNKTRRYNKDKNTNDNNNNNNNKTINYYNNNNNSCIKNVPAQKEKASNSKKYKRAKVKVKVPNFISAFESSRSSSSSSCSTSATTTTTTARSRKRAACSSSGSTTTAATVPTAAFSACGAFGLSLCALLLLRLAPAATGLAVGVDTTNANITDLGSPALALEGDAFIPHGAKRVFKLLNVVSIEDLRQPGIEETSYTFQTYLTFSSVWHNQAEQLLQVEFSHSTVNAPGKLSGQKSGKRRVTQKINKIPDRPFYISLTSGRPTKLIAHQSRDQSLLNLERGIASLFQVEFANGPVLENDVSGKCKSFYTFKSNENVMKYKTDCSNWDLRVNYRTERPLSLTQRSREHVVFDFSDNGALLKAESTETHRVFLEAKHDVGSQVMSRFSLTFIEALDETVNQIPENTLDEVFEKLKEYNRIFDLEADVDGSLSQIKDVTLKQRIAATVQQLTDKHIGHESLALTFAELLPLARITKEAEFVEILQAHKKLHAQLVDLLAAAQTADAHHAIHAVFNYDNQSDADLLEKYLQSLAIGSHPERVVIKDLFKRLLRDPNEEGIKNENLRDSVMQTVAALTRQSGFKSDDKLLNKVRTFILEQLNEKCNASSCKTVYIRALQNLRDISTISTLVEHAVEGEVDVSVAAMQALKSFATIRFNENHRKAFEQIFYQTKRKYDSSARTLALDILLELKLTKPQLGKLLDYLTSADRHFEIKTYVLQKLRTLAEKCSRFAAMLRASLAERPEVNNYHIIGQKGLTTVLWRELSQTPAFNESLLSVQEIYQGVLKRGSVELVLGAETDEFSTFKIGMYTKGLSSFVGDSNKVDENEDESPATAGMEISVQEVLLRPLVFFSGQSELMGHVWSGTASEPTPAFQATTVAQDHEHYVILSSGATMYMRVIGTKSVDLNGKVEMSLWNRNANTEIEQNSGDAIVGLTVAGFNYAKVENHFTVTSEPKIRLQADIDFYSGMKLCMQLQRPEMLMKQSNTKSVHLTATKPYAKHTRTKLTHKYPGRTLALNQKNNEMCNIIFGA